VTYDDATRAEDRVEVIGAALAALIEAPTYDPGAVDVGVAMEFSARSLAGRLAAVLDETVRRG
jgi:hypothetical protein